MIIIKFYHLKLLKILIEINIIIRSINRMVKLQKLANKLKKFSEICL